MSLFIENIKSPLLIYHILMLLSSLPEMTFPFSPIKQVIFNVCPYNIFFNDESFKFQTLIVLSLLPESK